MNKFKVAVVGPQIIHQAFQTMDENWDVQIPLNTVDDLFYELELDDSQARISKDTSLVILFARLFSDNPQRFAELVSYLAPYAVVCILIEPHLLEQQGYMEQTIRNQMYMDASQDETYNSNTPFYFVGYETAQVDIYNAIEMFVNSPIISNEIKDSIRPMLPNGSISDNYEDLNIEQNQEEEIIIPQNNGNNITICVTSSKGGSGKSTVAITLGAYLSKASKLAAEQGLVPKPLKICLVDLDTRDGQHWLLMGAKKPPTVMDILFNDNPYDPVNIQKGLWYSDKIDCDFLFAPKRPRNAKEIPANTYAQIITQLKNMYDVIILDTSVNYLDSLGEDVAYPISDRILFVSDMGQSSIVGCSRWIQEEMYAQERGDKNIPENKVGIIINKAMANVNMNSNKIQKCTMNLPIIAMIPSTPELVTYAANTAELHQILNHPPINEAFKDIAEAVLPEVPLANVPTR